MKGFIMKTSTVLALALSMGAVDAAQTGSQTGNLAPEDVQAVSPALDRYATDTLANGLWKRPGLSPRDRSIVTVAAVITRNQGILLPEQVNLALDNGVKPAEISEIITHLAFYAGWGNALAATAITKEVFPARGPGSIFDRERFELFRHRTPPFLHFFARGLSPSLRPGVVPAAIGGHSVL
jgi:4-carboxymuconolactone decarboxylase